MKIIHGILKDVVEGCYVVKAGDCEYTLPPNIGQQVPMEEGLRIQIEDDVYLEIHLPTEETEEVLDDLNANIEVETPNEVWKASRSPTTNDVNATIFFLQLRSSEKYEKQFNDKKNIKSKVWIKVAEQMNQKGFYVGSGKEGAEKCRQKYYSLQKTYVSVTKQSQQTGQEAPTLPPYFDLLEKLFGNKHNINPTAILDSFTGLSVPGSSKEKSHYSFRSLAEENVLSSPQESGSSFSQENRPISPEPETSFRNSSSSQHLSPETSLSQTSFSQTLSPQTSNLPRVLQKTGKPRSNTDKIIDAIKTINAENNQMSQSHFTRLESLLEEQNKYKREFLNLFKTKLKRKRQRSSSSESE